MVNVLGGVDGLSTACVNGCGRYYLQVVVGKKGLDLWYNVWHRNRGGENFITQWWMQAVLNAGMD